MNVEVALLPASPAPRNASVSAELMDQASKPEIELNLSE